jgi:hypothetical protein
LVVDLSAIGVALLVLMLRLTVTSPADAVKTWVPETLMPVPSSVQEGRVLAVGGCMAAVAGILLV